MIYILQKDIMEKKNNMEGEEYAKELEDTLLSNEH